MKILDSKIYDIKNLVLSFIQSKTDNIRQNSVILSNIDLFILLAIIFTYIFSTFMPTEIIGIVSVFVPLLVVLKVLITKNEKIELPLCNFYLLIYLLICFFSNFTSSMPFQSLYGFMKTIIYFAFYFALCQFLKSNKKYIWILLISIGLLISIESCIGVFQDIVKVQNISTWQDLSYVNPEDVLSRVYGTLKPYNPNLFGGWLIAGFPALIGVLGLSIYKKNTFLAVISVICSILCAYTIFLTGCRGAYLALFSIVLSVLINTFKRIKAYSGAFIALIIAFLALNHGILKRLMSIFIMRNDSSTSFRMNVYNSALQMFQDNPFFGVGVGNKVFREIYGLYMLSGFDALSCYCVFLEMAVESGIFALVSFLAFIFSLVIDSIKRLKSNELPENKIIIFTAFTAIIALMVHGIFDTVWFRPQIQFVFWTMASILTVILTKEKMAE